MALPSEADLCRKCGGSLEKGFIAGEGPWSQGTVRWYPAGPGDAVDPYAVGIELAPAPLTRFGKYPAFPARLCPKCKLVEFEYP